MVEQRPLGRARLARMELDESAADLDPRRPRRTGRSKREAERRVLARGLVRFA
jgi:hypothetical protein